MDHYEEKIIEGPTTSADAASSASSLDRMYAAMLPFCEAFQTKINVCVNLITIYWKLYVIKNEQTQWLGEQIMSQGSPS